MTPSPSGPRRSIIQLRASERSPGSFENPYQAKPRPPARRLHLLARRGSGASPARSPGRPSAGPFPEPHFPRAHARNRDVRKSASPETKKHADMISATTRAKRTGSEKSEFTRDKSWYMSWAARPTGEIRRTTAGTRVNRTSERYFPRLNLHGSDPDPRAISSSASSRSLAWAVRSFGSSMLIN